MSIPLAEAIRPNNLDEVVGQSHLLKPNMPLRRIIESGSIPNLIFYGPSGIGKTTVARIIAKNTNKQLYKLNGTSTSIAEIKGIIDELDTIKTFNGVLIYLDEIQYLNKKQQQSLLEYIENGKITLIASTTENPYFYIYNAILSRATVFEFKPVTPTEIKPAIIRAFDLLSKQNDVKIKYSDEVIDLISIKCGGDVRKALNTVELSFLSCDFIDGHKNITAELARLLSQKSSMRYDRDGDEHYDILSAFQKSIRGSDENASLHYLARLIEAGDLVSICRRLLVIACEDIGLAYPNAITIVKALVDSANQLGFPEARIPLAQAVILLSTSPKSNSAICAIDDALNDIRNAKVGDIPSNLKDSHYSGAKKLNKGQNYIYPHDFENSYVKQQYLPDNLKDKIYYNFGDNKIEQTTKQYWDKIKNKE
jgi:putative ATPase